MNELAIIETLTPAVFTEEGRVDSVLKDIQDRVANFNGDVSTAKGRAEIKSFAYQIAKSKTALDGLGKECVEDWKKKSKAVDAQRKHARETLESLQEQVRKPLTEWEQAEEDRVNALKERIQDLSVPANTYSESVKLKQILTDIEKVCIDESFQELQEVAANTKEATIIMLQNEIVVAEKREAEAAELDRLRKEAADRAQKDREEAIRKEVEERVKREVEEKAQKEREAVIRREAEAKAESERKELEAKLAIERAEREKIEAQQKAERAVEQERLRVAAEQARVAAEEARREANKKHKASVHKKAIEALQKAGVSKQDAEITLNAICNDLIPNITISY